MNKTIIILLAIFICFFEQTATAQSQQRNLYTATAQELYGVTDWDAQVLDSYFITGVPAEKIKIKVNDLWRYFLAQFQRSSDGTIFNCSFDTIYGIEVDPSSEMVTISGMGTKAGRFVMTNSTPYNVLKIEIETEKKSKHQYKVTIYTQDERLSICGKNLPSWRDSKIESGFFDYAYEELILRCSVDKEIWEKTCNLYLFGIIQEVGKNRPGQMLGLK